MTISVMPTLDGMDIRAFRKLAAQFQVGAELLRSDTR
jgi:hypothetical protein